MSPRINAKPILVAAAIAVFAGAYLSIYYISVKYFYNKSSKELSASFQQPLQPGLNELKLSTRLSLSGSNQGAQPLPGSPSIPVWLPTLLFGFTLMGGWWLSWWYSLRAWQTYGEKSLNRTQVSSGRKDASAIQARVNVPFDVDKKDSAELSKLINKLEQRDHQIATLNAKISSLRSECDLLESQSNESATSLFNDNFDQLKKEIQSKSEIIHTLEELVFENREKWLVSDNTESVMHKEIAELTENLNAAMTIIRAHDDTPSQSEGTEPGLEPPSGRNRI